MTGTAWELCYNMRETEAPWSVLYIDYDNKKLVACGKGQTMQDAIEKAALELNKEIVIPISVIHFRQTLTEPPPR